MTTQVRAPDTAQAPLAIRHDDDPRVVEEAATEDYSLHAVPPTWRMRRGSLTMAWWAVMTAFFYVYLAAFLALAYGTVNALVGIALTIVVFTAVNAVLLRTASRNGLTVALFSRGMFGYAGATVATLIFAATAIYYVVFEGSVIAVALQTFIGGPVELWYAVVVLCTAPLVWRGVRVWLDRFNAWMLPLYVVLMIAVIVWAVSSKGYHGFLPDAAAAPGTTLPWLQAFVSYMGLWILMMFTMDFARLAKPEDETYHRNVTFGWAYYLLAFGLSGLVGIFLTSTFGITFDQLAGQESALPVAIVDVTGVVGLALIVVTQMRINTVNLYLASTNLQSFASRALRITLPRTVWVLVAGAIAFGMMLTNVFSYVLDALNYQGIAIVAWVAVALAYVLHLRRTGADAAAQEFRPGRTAALNPGGLGAWVVATVVGLVLKITDTDTSQFNELWGLPITAVLAFGLGVVGFSVARPSWFALARPHDPRLEVDDAWEARVQCHVCDRSYVAVEMDRDPSAGGEAICASCGTGSTFLRAAHDEARHPASAAAGGTAG
jgi:purine-cytosine permease-like protein